MNVLYATPNPLPTILDAPFDGPARRRCINGFQLSTPEMDRFNRVLAAVGRREMLGTDQLASAGRELCRPGRTEGPPACIHQRLRWIGAIEQLLGSKVASIRTSIAHGKVKRQGRFAGQRPDWKKAYVKLREGEKMPEFLEGA